MREALRLAHCGAGTASPNPMVGAVVVSQGRIVGRGYHHRPGTAHAEVLALQEAGSAAGGATLYVTLEPCAHSGRTGPCTEAIIGGGIRRVVAAMEDPDRQVCGRGLRRLREAGIETVLGVAEDAARHLNEAYVKHRTTGLPFVTAKWAMTLDGRIATGTGDSRWISGEASRGLVHEARASTDAILVGIGTVLRDDPRLTARGPAHHQPARIVVDSTLRIPPAARVLTPNGAPVIVATSSRAPQAARAALEARGVDVWVADGLDRWVDVKAILAAMGRRGMTSVLVEGGARIHGTFMDAGLVDKVVVFLGPVIVGGAGPGPVAGAGADTIARALRLVRTVVRQVDQDVVIEGYLPATIGREEDVRRCSPGS